LVVTALKFCALQTMPIFSYELDMIRPCLSTTALNNLEELKPVYTGTWEGNNEAFGVGLSLGQGLSVGGPETEDSVQRSNGNKDEERGRLTFMGGHQ
jgi:hypothetical protein